MGVLHPAGTLRRARSCRRGDPRAQGRARPIALARAGQAARRRDRRGRPRRVPSSSSSPARRCVLGGENLASVRPGIDVDVTREPLGVVAAITPWNFPLAIPAWKIAPALAFGNTVVFKPAELVPASPWTLVDIVQRAGLPPGVLNLVMGPGSRSAPRWRRRLTSTRSASPARRMSGRRSRRPRSAMAPGYSSRWAARTRSSCSTTRTCRRRCRSPSTARSFRPDSAARHRAGSSSPRAFTIGSSPRWSIA